VSKPWKPGKQLVELRGSRIRREPVRPSRIRRDPVRREKQIVAASEEREIWGGIAGVVLIAVALAVVILGLSAATIFHNDRADTQSSRFGQCVTELGPNCVLDGETIHVDGSKVVIAGIEAPGIENARCSSERDKGIIAAIKLADLLNSGEVVAGPALRDEFGREVHKVEVKGQDVGQAMIAAGVARRYDGLDQGWCDGSQSTDS
jgi:endonuclease YncB( thermonuclease family)